MEKRVLWSFLVISLGLLAVACDSDDPDEVLTDAEKFIGIWTVQVVTDDNGDQTDRFFESTNSVTLDFSMDGQYSLLADAKTDSLDQTIAGSFTVNEGLAILALEAEALLFGQDVTLESQYAFIDDDTVNLTTDSFVLNAVLRSEEPLVGAVTLTIRRSS